MKSQKLILNYVFTFISVLLITLFSGQIFQNSKSGINLSKKLNCVSDDEKILVWIYFNDKGNSDITDRNEMKNYLTDKSIERRILRAGNKNIFSDSDLPVNSEYIKRITELGITIKHKSKWFNSVSCYAAKNQIELAERLDIVKQIELVVKYRKSLSDQLSSDFISEDKKIQTDNPESINYGPSLAQDTLINVPQVHSRGITGEGILIASFDAGFDNLQHICFQKIREKGLRTYDFVNGDTIVANGAGREGNGAHGTLTLSLAGGYDPGFLVSPAFDSKYILAKTENTNSETPLEEDNWVAAAEWADSLGADIITSSLGYLNFESPYTSYTWEDMNGSTALITRAADIAVSKGIVVVISAGNDGYNASHNTLNAPADAFNVITVGSVNINRQRSSFSAVGPTADGRIKPEVMALGNYNVCARPGNNNTGYTTSNTGTSLACPMVAGVCALILCANNSLTPAEVKEILLSTSDNNVSPNNLSGWGTVNASYAVEKATGKGVYIPSEYQLFQNYPNPFNPVTTINYKLSTSGFVTVRIFSVSGKEISTIVNQQQGAGSYSIKYFAENISSGIYFYSLYVNGNLSDTKKLAFIK
jgi:hypothetical protein